MRLEVYPRTDLTLRVLQTLAAGGRWRASDIADAVGSSANYVARLFAPLSHAGWVRSTPGPTGGYDLAVSLDDISVLDLIEAVEGSIDDGRCVLLDRSCPGAEPCALHDAWAPARAAMIEHLSSTPLSSLFQRSESLS